MNQATRTFDFLLFVPLCLAVLFWLHHLYLRSVYKKFENMKRQQRWCDLPRRSATEDKEETLNAIIVSEQKRIDSSFKFSVMYSVIAAFWLLYMS